MSSGIKRVRGREDMPSDSDASDFEDAFDDVYDDEDEGEYNAGSPTSARSGSDSPTPVAEDGPAAAGAGSGMDEKADGGAEAAVATPWRPGLDAMAEGEVLDYDPSAYVMYHAMNVDWPCLSFDTVPDKLGASRSRFPLSCTVVAGTQADKASSNKVLVMRFGHLQRTQRDGREDESDSDEDESDSDEDDDDPTVDVQRINHFGSVNRIRTMPQEPNVVATWSDTGKVHLFDIRPQLHLLDAAEGKGVASPVPRGYGPVMTFAGHASEGFAIDWSLCSPGRLVTGDCSSTIYVWDVDSAAAAAAMGEGATAAELGAVWKVDTTSPSLSHKGSVEDLQWSPNEATVFASCSVDKTVRIWDTRARGKAQLTVRAHDADVNVINWSKLVSYLMVSGSDDGSFKIWDLRNFKADAPITDFRWHKKPITAVEWAYDDENVLAVASEDNQVTLWDMSLEQDDEAELALLAKQGKAEGALPSSKDEHLAVIPPQLLFIHAGQEDVKEVHFHRQLPGVMISTAADGFNVFKPDVHLTT